MKICLGLVFAAVCLAQDPSVLVPVPVPPPATVVRSSPQYLVGFGAGFNTVESPKINGWTVYGVKVSENIYATTIIDLTGSDYSYRGGLERIMLREGPLIITAKGDFGIGTNDEQDVGGVMSGGGSVLVDISKFTKTPGTYFIGSVTFVKSTIEAPRHPIFRFGFGKTF